MSLTSRSAASLAILSLPPRPHSVAVVSCSPATTPTQPRGWLDRKQRRRRQHRRRLGRRGSGMIVMKDPSNYPQNTAGATFPYPQGHAFAHCTLPAYDTDKVAMAYTAWKAKFFDGSRVIRPENNNDTASEGIAYGMLIGVYMNDQPMFDTLWNYARSKLDGNGLMTWHYSSSGRRSSIRAAPPTPTRTWRGRC